MQNLENGKVAAVDNKFQNLINEANRLKAAAILKGENATKFDEQIKSLQEMWKKSKNTLNDRKALLKRLSGIDLDHTPIGKHKF